MDDLRSRCVEAMRKAYRAHLDPAWAEIEENMGREAMEDAFDALHGIVCITPLKAIGKMEIADKSQASMAKAEYLMRGAEDEQRD